MRSIGLPVPAPSKSCEDPRCPFHGKVTVRGRVMKGRAVSLKDRSTIVVLREYQKYAKKYARYERRRSRIHAHLPPCVAVGYGDAVTVGECRPLSKTVSFVVLARE